ncbi:hypothetical protein FZEAL_7441 [Fusarium zealandicum]|uniref:Inner centromere protein ARK-binding domain-containing protein n=1 Tax=Fusarium zealandicum TaxID=1053134 RepID=A0A8H4XIV3_9HYPO|nr:hypothetical protein FZEAL_7441 [Fusarium zealandicum]
MRGPRIPTGSAAWVADERASALQIVDVEVDEFTYAAHNELTWLNEHMAGIFSENETNIAETFKTPGKLRGKTPRTARKLITTDSRVPLSDVFGTTPISSANRFAQHLRAQSPLIQKDVTSNTKSPSPRRHAPSPKPTLTSPDKPFRIAQEDHVADDAVDTESVHDALETVEENEDSAVTAKQPPPVQDSGYFGSQDVNPANNGPIDQDEVLLDHTMDLDEPVSVPAEPTPPRTVPQKQPATIASPVKTQQVMTITSTKHDEEPHESGDESRSQSDGYSPIHPGFRKSSLLFPSLPAREPLPAGKNAGARASRTSHLDLKRTSYLGRQTGGKSLGNHGRNDASDDDDHDEMDVDDFPSVPTNQPNDAENFAVNYNKTATQRLQDQINMLGKSQPNGSRPSKSIHSLTNLQQPVTVASQAAPEPKSPSPKKPETTTTPGAFPEDDDDDWIDPPAAEPVGVTNSASRPGLEKSLSADVMEGIHGKKTLGSLMDLDIEERAKTQSPTRGGSTRQRPNILGHGKSASVPVVPLATSLELHEGSPLKKTVSASNPSVLLATVAEAGSSQSPAKSPSRSFRDSPLKQIKNKVSSIFKSSRGLIASGAALSAEGKSSMLSPSTNRLGLYAGQSSESVVPKSSMDLHRAGSPFHRQASPSRPVAKRTRASSEREKEEKRLDKEAKLQATQMEKLEKEREKEREKVRVFSKEQEKIAALEKQFASKKENEPPVPDATPKATGSSPRKAKPQQEEEPKAADQDVEIIDAPSVAPPPSASRPAGPNQPVRAKEIRRPTKPGKESHTKTTTQAPTVIRVNTGSQHSQYHPPGSSLSSSIQSHAASTSSQASKASKASLQTKTSVPSLKLAAKKKEQDEREAQRRRDAKAEIERKRAAAQEEQKKQEQVRRQEAERERQKQKQKEAEAKKSAHRQAIEKAKQTPAPPPAARSQPGGPLDHGPAQKVSSSVQRSDVPPVRPPSRMNSGIHRSQDDTGRPVNAVLMNASKSGPKRPLGQDAGEEGPARPAASRGPQYQAKDAKRRRTSDEFADELKMDQPPNIKGPPVRPSSALKRDLQAKNFQNGYVPQSATRDLFKTVINQQHSTQVKGGHPLDMAQIHKGAIPFAPNPNPAGPSFKTPARLGAVKGVKSAAKSAQRSSPRFQNGDDIELAEIQTDDEDEDDEEPHGGTVASWTASPDLRGALVLQETMDPSQIFGPPRALNMEEVFSKSKDRFHKFRARTSSANWSGPDRLTEDDIRKDLAARDKLRREGVWSYELSRDMM